MSLVPCPGCGLPRAAEQVTTSTCPVCATVGVITSAMEAARPAPPPSPDPTAGLPADASELNRVARVASTQAGWIGWVVVFVFGALTGAGGLLGWQTLTRPRGSEMVGQHSAGPAGPVFAPPPAPGPPDVTRPGDAPPPSSAVPAPSSADPPAPSVPRPDPSPPRPAPSPAPAPAIAPPPDPPPVAPPPLGAAPTKVVELNQPQAVYVAAPLRRGEQVQLRGKVKTLRVLGVENGSQLDASRLETEAVFIGGKVSGRSVLRVHTAAGSVQVAAPIADHATVVIHAPRGTVRFAPPESSPAVDGGSSVEVTARGVDLQGEVNGVETRVRVHLPDDGFLRFAALRGLATLEYRSAGPDGRPEVVAGSIAPTASFRRVE